MGFVQMSRDSKNKIGIIGAGWYGCHIARQLRTNYPNHHIDLFEKTGDCFNGSSSANQNRLHLGFHYMRSCHTRKECQNGYDRFVKDYPSLCKHLNNNLYVVHKYSNLDYTTIKHVLKYEQIPFRELPLEKFHNIIDSDSIHPFVFDVDELFIDYKKAKAFFSDDLKDCTHYEVHFDCLLQQFISSTGSVVAEEKDYDYIIVCAFQSMFDREWTQRIPVLKNANIHIEKCISLLYQCSSPLFCSAVTVIDGNFFSLYPYDIEKNLFTLTHVKYTPISSDEDLLPLEELVQLKRLQFETDVLSIIPTFFQNFTYHSQFISYKVKKMNNKTDDRSVEILSHGKFSFIFGGKITGIFNAYDNLVASLAIT